MEWTFHLPGIIMLFTAFLLLLLVSMSLPYLDALDFVRVYVHSGAVMTSVNGTAISQIRFGLWANCAYESSSGDRLCIPASNPYSTTLYTNGGSNSVDIGDSWTRGLVIHPIATAASLLALFFSFFTHPTLTCLTYLISFLAALLAVIAFFADIALYACVNGALSKLPGINSTTHVEPAFVMTIIAVVLLFFAGLSIWLGRRRARMAGATSYKMPSSHVKRPPRTWNWRLLYRRLRVALAQS